MRACVCVHEVVMKSDQHLTTSSLFWIAIIFAYRESIFTTSNCKGVVLGGVGAVP